MTRHRSPLAVVLCLLGVLGPWVLDAGLAVHVTVAVHHADEADHHDGGGHDGGGHHESPGAVHGHAHEDGTPPHGHGASLPDAAARGARALDALVTVSAAPAALPAAGSAALLVAPALAPSPPTLRNAVLRI